MEKREVSFGRGDERGVPKMRIFEGSNGRVKLVEEIHLSREDAERLYREIGVVLLESK